MKDGEYMFNRCCNKTKTRIDPCCQVVQPTNNYIDCGVSVVSEASTNIATICSRVTYTVTVTNTTDMTIKNAILTVPLDGVLAIVSNSVTVNGQSVDVENLDQISLGDIEAGGSSVVTYTVVVMEYKRYVYTRAIITFCACCCFERRVINVVSNLNLLQVCQCCYSSTSSNVS